MSNHLSKFKHFRFDFYVLLKSFLKKNLCEEMLSIFLLFKENVMGDIEYYDKLIPQSGQTFSPGVNENPQAGHCDRFSGADSSSGS